MKKYFVVKFLLIVLILILLPMAYIGYDRFQMPPPPVYTSPPYIPGQSWEDYARDFLNQSNQPNALEYYLLAFSNSSIDIRNINWALPNNPWRSMDTILRIGWTKDYPEVDEIIQLNQNAIDKIIQGTQMQQCELPPLPYDVHAPILDFFTIQTLGKLLAVTGKKLESQNKYSDALSYYFTGIQFGKDMDAQHMISRLICLAVVGINTRPILHLIFQNKLTEPDYYRIIEQMHRFEQDKVFNYIIDVIEFEYRIRYNIRYRLKANPKDIAAFLDPQANQPKPKDYLLTGYFILNRGRVLNNQVIYHNELISAASTKTYLEFVNIDWMAKFPKDRINRRFDVEYTHVYTRQMTILALLRLTQLQSAIQLYHLQKKQYPSGLDDLTDYLDPIPLDPFTAQPFLWSMDTSGRPFVYSTGPDFQDHQALIPYDPTNGTVSTGDIWF